MQRKAETSETCFLGELQARVSYFLWRVCTAVLEAVWDVWEVFFFFYRDCKKNLVVGSLGKASRSLAEGLGV